MHDYDDLTRRLADLIVGFGANVQPGQLVGVTSYVGKEALTREIARAGYVAGASYRDGAFSLRAGRTSTLVVTGQARRPGYYAPVLYPHKPTQRLTSFNAAGHNRWTLAVTPSRSMRNQPYWNLGVKIGDTMHVVKVRVTG